MGKPTEREKNLSSQLYEEIKKRIIELELSPGSSINERELVEILGVSRTPIREAIIRLTQEGWIITSDRRSSKVKALSPKYVREIFQFREMIEVFSLKIAFKNEEQRCLAGKLDLASRKMKDFSEDPVGFIKADLTFHGIIVENTGNEFFNRVWSNIRDELARIAIFSMDAMRKPEKIVNEHNSIVEALWANKEKEVMQTLRDHYHMILAGFDRCYEQKIDKA